MHQYCKLTIFIFCRQEEKDRLSIKPKDDEKKKQSAKRKRDEDDASDLEDYMAIKRKNNRDKDNDHKKKKQPMLEEKSARGVARDRALRDLELASMTRAKMSKSSHKPKKIRTVYEPEPEMSKPMHKKVGSKFAFDLADTSAKGVKKLRYFL